MIENSKYFKEFVRYASLNVLGMLGISCYILADTFFISQGLGSNGLTALNLAIPVYSFVHGCGLMLGMGGAIKYSIFKGQQKLERTHEIFTNTVYLAVMAAIVFVLGGLFCSEPMTALLGADQEVFSMTNTYIKVILFFSPAFLMNNILICFVRNDGSPQLSMTAMIGGSLSNVLLDYIFIFPLHMGILGAVLATGVAPLISMAILSYHWIRKRNGFRFVKMGIYLKNVRSILTLGFPSLISEVSSGIVMIVFNIILLELSGNVGVAAYGVIANLSLVVVSIYTGIAQGIQPLFSKAYGENDSVNIKKVLRYALFTMLILSGMIYLVMFVFADPIVGAFNSEHQPQLQEIAVKGLKIYFTSIAFAGFNIILSVLFTATEKVVPAHMISLLRGLFLIVPMAFLLSSLCGITGVWFTLPLTESIVAVLGSVIYVLLQHTGRASRKLL